MCGEHRSIVGIGVACQGSSPHVRGARLGSTLNAAAMGIIPACAGSTLSLSTTQALRWDHPRMCGEHLLNAYLDVFTRDHPRMCGEHYFGDTLDSAVWGSSPHVRGAQPGRDGIPKIPGIIPACAGSTFTCHEIITRIRDHPRMCGEHYSNLFHLLPPLGSSPHVRGAPDGRPWP